MLQIGIYLIYLSFLIAAGNIVEKLPDFAEKNQELDVFDFHLITLVSQ